MSLCVVAEPTLEQYEQIVELKRKGVLEDADNHNHQYRKYAQPFDAVVTYVCPDCQHEKDKVGYYRDVLGQMPHDLSSMNGGAIALPADSPLNKWGEFPLKLFIEQAIGAGALKHTKESVIGTHTVCGAASKALSIIQQVELLLVARADVEQGFAEAGEKWQVIPHYHVYYGSHKVDEQKLPVRKTKRLNLQKWLEAREGYRSELRTLRTRRLDEVLV